MHLLLTMGEEGNDSRAAVLLITQPSSSAKYGVLKTMFSYNQWWGMPLKLTAPVLKSVMLEYS